MGQFTQLDPIGMRGGLNLYGYANSDPVNFSDPSGLAPCTPGESVIHCDDAAPYLGAEFSRVAADEGCIPCIIAGGWALLELGLSAYDAWEFLRAVERYESGTGSGGDVALAGGFVVLGVLSPGGGYSAARNAASRIVRVSVADIVGTYALRPGRNAHVWEAPGGPAQLIRMFTDLSGGLPRSPHAARGGGYIVNLPGGGTIGYRFTSQTGGPALDFHNIPNMPNTTIHVPSPGGG